MKDILVKRLNGSLLTLSLLASTVYYTMHIFDNIISHYA